MRFRLTLHIDRNYGDRLPFNYQYEQSAVIYHILSRADKQFAIWLHDNGYKADGGKRFKLFTFSRFSFERYGVDKENKCLIVMGDKVTWTINFLPEKSTQKFIQGLFADQHILIGNKQHHVAFDIVQVEALPTIKVTSEMKFRATSPVCIKEHVGNRIRYMSPNDSHYGEAILKGLLSRYQSLKVAPFLGDISSFNFAITDKNVKSALITIKADTPQQTCVKGYLYAFKLAGPEELLRLAYEGGIGEQCSQGFGYIETIGQVSL